MNDSSIKKIEPGLLVGDYKIIEIIDSDKSGQSCHAADTQLDKNVIIKFLPKSYSIKQLESAVKLSHPNIISINETGQFKNQNYLVTEYIEGKKLSEFISEGSVSEEFTIDVAIQLSDALAYAHSENIIHGGMTTDNIFIDTEGRPKLSEFGIHSTKKKIQEDLYAVGLIMYEMLTGKPQSVSYSEGKLRQVLNKYSDKLNDIIIKILCKGGEYQSVDELYNDLVTLPQSKKLSSQKPVDWWNRIVVPAAFVVLVIVAIYWLMYIK